MKILLGSSNVAILEIKWGNRHNFGMEPPKDLFIQISFIPSSGSEEEG